MIEESVCKKRMQEECHLFIHDRFASVLMIIVFSLSFFVVCNVVKMQNEGKIGRDQKEKESYGTERIYQCCAEIEEEHTENEETIINKLRVNNLNINKGNVILFDHYTVGSGNYYTGVNIVLQYNELLSEELQKGRYPTETEIQHQRRCVVIGEGLVRHVKKKKKSEVISIDGIDYEVLGILKDITGNKMDDRMIVFYNSLSKQTQKNIDDRIRENKNFIIKYGTNHGQLEDVQILEEWIYNIADKQYISLLEEEEDDYSFRVATEMRIYNQYTLNLMFVFCLCSCFIVSSTWIKRRRKELVVRKALGSGFVKVMSVLLKDIAVMIGLSIMVDIILLSLQILITGNNWIRQAYFWGNIKNIMIAVGMVLVVALIRPLYIVATISPAEGTRTL